MDLAPVVLFVYNRPEHTRRTIRALEKNRLADRTAVYIFADGPKNSADSANVYKVREVIRENYKFKKVEIFESKHNKGLANSIIEGVTRILTRYGRVIVLEDDLVTSHFFLEFMNECLEKYSTNKNIWSISGYTPNIDIHSSYQKNIYLGVRACSWGWATWKDRWETIDWEIKDYQQFSHNKDKIKRFNNGGNDMFYMLEDQMKGRINSWAIRWCYNQFKQSKYTIYPVKSLVSNIGLDFSGTHSSNNKKYKSDLYDFKPKLVDDISPDEKIMREFKQFYDLSFKGYIGVFLRKVALYKFVRSLLKKFS